MQGAMKWSDFTMRFDGKHDPKSSLASDRATVRICAGTQPRAWRFSSLLSSLAWGAVILIASLITGA